MSIPDYETMMLPLLNFLGDKKEHALYEVIEHIAEVFNISERERRELMPSGSESIIKNRVRWARRYLDGAGLIESAKRDFCNITERGIEVLYEKPTKVDVKFLRRFPEFVQFLKLRRVQMWQHMK